MREHMKVLVVDGDRQQAENVKSNIEFMDFSLAEAVTPDNLPDWLPRLGELGAVFITRSVTPKCLRGLVCSICAADDYSTADFLL